MTLEQFSELLDVHGADLQRFPPEQRAAALRLLNESDEAKLAHREAERLDAALSSLAADAPSPDLSAGVLSIPSRHPRPSAWWPFATHYRPALAMAAAALMGIGVGNWTFVSTEPAAAVEAAASKDPRDEELSPSDVEELAELAFAGDLQLPEDSANLDEASP